MSRGCVDALETLTGFNYHMKSWLRGSCVGNYMHGVMRIGKRVNAKVMNYDLRDLNTEMNKRT